MSCMFFENILADFRLWGLKNCYALVQSIFRYGQVSNFCEACLCTPLQSLDLEFESYLHNIIIMDGIYFFFQAILSLLLCIASLII